MTNKCGTTAYSFTQQFLLADATRFAVGGKLYLYEAGTTTPVNGYKDTAAINVHPNPITLAADGRIPLIYFIMAHDNAVPGTFVTQRSSVRMRLTDASGVVQFDTDPVPLMTSDPAGGTGGVADTTDPDALYKTGDMKVRYGTGFLSGFVRANGKTLGSTASGATELANDVLAQALYLYLWQVDASLRSGSTTGSASSDFSSGKLLTLPDFSGRVLGFLDNMSDAARNVLTTLTFATAGRGPGVLGAASTWAEVLALGTINLPAHDHPAFINDPQHTHAFLPAAGSLVSGGGPIVASGGSSGAVAFSITAASTGVRVKSAAAGVADDKTGLTGGASPIPLVQPTKLVTAYLKL